MAKGGEVCLHASHVWGDIWNNGGRVGLKKDKELHASVLPNIERL